MLLEGVCSAEADQVSPFTFSVFFLVNCSLQVFSMRYRSSLAPHFIYSVTLEALNWSVLLVLLNC